MASVTYFVVQPFEKTGRGMIRAGRALTAQSAAQARSMAARLAEKGGAIAFSRTGDPEAGNYDEALILGTYGQIPEDAIELAAAAA